MLLGPEGPVSGGVCSERLFRVNVSVGGLSDWWLRTCCRGCWYRPYVENYTVDASINSKSFWFVVYVNHWIWLAHNAFGVVCWLVLSDSFGYFTYVISSC